MEEEEELELEFIVSCSIAEVEITCKDLFYENKLFARLVWKPGF